MFGDILTILRLLFFDLVLAYHTWIVAVVGFVIFLIPVTRKHWWIPLAALVVLGIIWFWFALVTPINNLNVLAQSFWFFSAAVCLSYGYVLALILLGIKKLVTKKEATQ